MPDRDKIFQPRLIATLKQYNLTKLRADVLAGLTVGLVALPLAMAFAIASGVRPEAGLFTAIVAGFLISAFGGSRVQIGGPTGAFVVLVYGIVAKYGLEKLIICTIMAGVFLVIMGLAHIGNAVKYIPYPVTTGFTTGIAVLIASTQIKDFFGLRAEAAVPSDFAGKLWYFARNFESVHWLTAALGLASLAVIILWPKKWARYAPAYVVAMFAGTAAVMLLAVACGYHRNAFWRHSFRVAVIRRSAR